MKKTISLLLLLMLLTAAGYADDVRAMGMGGAFVAVADDATAIIYNPAGMTQIKTISLKFGVGVEIADEENYQNVINYFKSDTTFKDPNSLMNINTSFNTRATGNIGFATSRFGLSLLPNFQVIADVQNNQLTMTQLSTSNLALALPLADFTRALGNFSLGTNLKLYHAEIDHFELAAGNVGVKQKTTPGQGVGVDIGLLANFGMLKAGINVKDVYSKMVWDPVNQNSYTSSFEPIMNLGVAVKPPRTGLTLAADYTDVVIKKGLNGKVRVGFEQTLLWLFDIRGGATMYKDLVGEDRIDLSAGLGLNFGPVQADIALRSSDFFKKTADASLAFTIQF